MFSILLEESVTGKMTDVRIGSRSPLEKSTAVRTGSFWEAAGAWRRGVVQHVTTRRGHQDRHPT